VFSQIGDVVMIRTETEKLNVYGDESGEYFDLAAIDIWYLYGTSKRYHRQGLTHWKGSTWKTPMEATGLPRRRCRLVARTV
jgi:hypothetical protein